MMMVFMCFMPETPRFLLSQGKRREAEEAVRFLRGPDAPAEWECARIEEASDNQVSFVYSLIIMRYETCFEKDIVQWHNTRDKGMDCEILSHLCCT